MGSFRIIIRIIVVTYGSFKLTNINLTAVTTKSFKEILQLPEWREGSVRFLVNIDDYQNEELNDRTSSSELLTKLMNEDIYFIVWGNSKNQQQFNDVIASNENKGTFINNTSYSNSLNLSGEYISEIVYGKQQTTSQYVIVNEPIELSVSPAGIMTNTIDENWPYGKWKIEHNYTYFENNMGQFKDSGKMIDDIITTFDKTGLYKIYYENQLVSPNEIYVHRKPVAQINLQRTGDSITLTSGSYDVDQISQENRGIAEEEWKWKASNSNTWTTGKLTTIDSNLDYIVSLRVKDNQNTWSDITTQYITSSANVLPVASFSIENPTLTKYETLVVNDASYDPAGGTITGYSWEVKNSNGQTIYTGQTPKTTFTDTELGEYTLYLTVTKQNGKVSEAFGRKFTIINDETAPEVVVNPVESDWSESVDVNLEFYDQGGSEFKNYKYAITDSQGTPDNWNEGNLNNVDTITIDSEGINYLHIIATDNAGNESEDRITGPYKIDRSAPQISLDGDFTNKKIDSVDMELAVNDSLSGVKSITVNNQDVSAGTVTFLRNGEYTIKATDNLDHENTATYTINNIYYNCDAELEHPEYSSSLEECPICALTKDIQVTNDSVIYNGQQQGITYTNPGNSNIVEYYNSSTTKPTEAGTYNYELKVIYDSEEYKTGKTGIFTIDKKDITVTGISGETKQYDGNTLVNIIGGSLVGVEDGDVVTLNVPQTGNTSSAEVGEWNVAIDDLTISGDDVGNYNLIQPSEDSIKATIILADTFLTISADDKVYDGVPVQGTVVTQINTSPVEFKYYKKDTNEEVSEAVDVGEYYVQATQVADERYAATTSNIANFEITKKEISISEITASEKQYDGNNTVQLTYGDVVGIVAGDEVTLHTPETGRTTSPEVGEWDVEIDEITMTGNDIGNYVIKQPQLGDVKATITLADVRLTISAQNKVYDGTPVQASVATQINTSPVEFKYYKKDTNEEVSAAIEVGEYYAQATQVADERYDATVSNIVNFEITKKEITISEITATEKKYDGNSIVQLTFGDVVGIVEGDDVTLHFPETGNTTSPEVGEWDVEIDEITITGNDIDNYVIRQPQLGDVKGTITLADTSLTISAQDKVYDGTPVQATVVAQINTSPVEYKFYKKDTNEEVSAAIDVGEYYVQATQVADERYDATISNIANFEITKKEISIAEITVPEKQYDRNDIVKVYFGDIIGIVEGDDVTLHFPKTGKTTSPEVGEWDVELEEITMTGNDVGNYVIRQPQLGEVKGTITLADAALTIYAQDKVYNGEPAKATVIVKTNTSPVEYKFYKKDTNEEVSEAVDIGEYYVQATQVADSRYKATTSNIIDFKIIGKEISLLGIVAKEKQYDGNNTVELYFGDVDGIVEGDDVTLHFPETGRTTSPEVGEWDVEIDEITMTGNDIGNYLIKQPQLGDVKGTITLSDAILTIFAQDKVYDGTPVESLVIERTNTSPVVYKYYKKDTDEEVNEAVDVGEYYVQATQVADSRYNSTISNTVNFEITKKEISIKDITATEKQYDGNSTVQLNFGDTDGVLEGDDVTLHYPETGNTTSPEVGEWNVEMDEFTMTGNNISNYVIRQPELGDVKGTITLADVPLTIYAQDKVYNGEPVQATVIEKTNSSPVVFKYYKKDTNEEVNKAVDVGEYYVQATQVADTRYNATISNIVNFEITKREIYNSSIIARQKQYDGNNIVQLYFGETIGIVEGDDVTLHYPETGRTTSPEVGEWNVEIDEITMTGNDIGNYVIRQPQLGEVKGNIILSDIPLTILAKGKVYDGTPVVATVVEQTNTSPVVFKYYKKGTNEEVSEAVDAGEYYVQATQVADERYDATISNTVNFEITRKELSASYITATEKQYDGNRTIQLNFGDVVGIVEGDDVTLHFPETGRTTSPEVGKWNVEIDEITMSGNDIGNYVVRQPQLGDVKGTITLVDAPLTILAQSKVYDGTPVEAIVVEQTNTSPVVFKYYKKDTNEEVSEAIDAGEYYVKATQVTDERHEGTVSNIVNFEITKKEISISGIIAMQKQYDGNNVVQLVYGDVEGIVEGDDVTLHYPETGRTTSAEVGEWNVEIDEITMTGNDIGNYVVRQPQLGDVKGTITISDSTLTIFAQSKVYDGVPVQATVVSQTNTSPVVFKYYKKDTNEEVSEAIEVGEYYVQATQVADERYDATISNTVNFEVTKKEISIPEITAMPKQYDGDNIVQLTHGDVVGIVEGDDVTLHFPKTGKTTSPEVGEWNVEIDEVTMTGNDIGNYVLSQPQLEDVKAEILLADSRLEIEVKSKVYDGKKIDVILKERTNPSEVIYKFYLQDTNEEVKEAKKAGKYYVIAMQEENSRYNEVVSDKVSFEIKPKKLTVVGIKSTDKLYDENPNVVITYEEIKGIIPGDDVKLKELSYGKAESSQPGFWNVNLPKLELEGKDAENYEIEYELKDVIKVSIDKLLNTELPKTGISILPLLLIIPVLISTIVFAIKSKKIKGKIRN